MQTERLFFPSKGRLERRVIRRKATGLTFAGSVWAFWWGPFCQFLVFEQR